MSAIKTNIVDLYERLRKIVEGIPSDFGGGSPFSKSLLMSHLMLKYELKNYVEIGVYKGRSFFPMAYTAMALNGMAYGIDAYDNETAREYDLKGDFGKQVNDFIEQADFSRIHKDVLQLQKELRLSEHSRIIKEKSSLAVERLRRDGTVIDLLHIDGNHDTKFVTEDVDLYLPLMRNGGFVVLDDINWDSVKPVFDRLRERFEVVFENGYFAILDLGGTRKKDSTGEKEMLRSIYANAENLDELKVLLRARHSWSFAKISPRLRQIKMAIKNLRRS